MGKDDNKATRDQKLNVSFRRSLTYNTIRMGFRSHDNDEEMDRHYSIKIHLNYHPSKSLKEIKRILTLTSYRISP